MTTAHDAAFSDPVVWCEATFGDRLWSRQRDILAACERESRVAVKAGHGVGKSFCAARVALRRWLRTAGSVLITTAPTYRQVNDLLWREIRACDRASRGTLAPCRPLQTPRWDADGTERWLAMGISTDNADMLQGYHDRELIAVIDEAAGVEEWVWGAILALQPKFILAIGNPTDPDSEFARCWDDPRWRTFSIPCGESPNLTGECRELWGGEHPALCSAEWVEEVRDRYGESSPYWISRVDARFPESGEDALIPGAWMDACRGQGSLTRTDVTLGVDVAAFGGDTTCVAIWRGLTLIDLRELPACDLMETVGRVARIAQEFPGDVRIAVDDTGLCGVASRLREVGWAVVPIVPGEGAKDPERYVNSRAEMSWTLREAIRGREVSIAGDFPRLHEEARKTRYTVTSGGKIQIQAKDQIRARLGRSPDALDAAMYGFWVARDWRSLDWGKSQPRLTAEEEFARDVGLGTNGGGSRKGFFE